jgi:hypothetical protein
MSLRLLLALGCLLPAASFRASGTVGSASTAQRARPAVCGVANVPKTVGEARTGFNKAYGRPVDGVQQGFVNEMLTGCQLALISPGYAPSRVFSLGFESLCTAFLANSGEGPKIHDALLAGLGMDAKKLVSEAEALKAAAAGMSEAVRAHRCARLPSSLLSSVAISVASTASAVCRLHRLGRLGRLHCLRRLRHPRCLGGSLATSARVCLRDCLPNMVRPTLDPHCIVRCSRPLLAAGAAGVARPEGDREQARLQVLLPAGRWATRVDGPRRQRAVKGGV